jgi:hypothetical protein
MLGAGNVLDIVELITLGAATGASAGNKADHDADVAIEVDRGVDTVTAVEPIGAAAALEDVVAAEPVDQFTSGIANDGIGVVGHTVEPINHAVRTRSKDEGHDSLPVNMLTMWVPIHGVRRSLTSMRFIPDD